MRSGVCVLFLPNANRCAADSGLTASYGGGNVDGGNSSCSIHRAVRLSVRLSVCLSGWLSSNGNERTSEPTRRSTKLAYWLADCLICSISHLFVCRISARFLAVTHFRCIFVVANRQDEIQSRDSAVPIFCSSSCCSCRHLPRRAETPEHELRRYGARSIVPVRGRPRWSDLAVITIGPMSTSDLPSSVQ